ncbi:MAG: NUDIX hydrolase [Micrococcales bacterium]
MHKPERPLSALHVKHRETARAFVINSRGQILLIKTHWDPGTGLPPRWLTPGGGIDNGETTVQAARREIWEELGLDLDPVVFSEEPEKLEFKIDWADSRFETGIAYFFTVNVNDDFQPNNQNWTNDEHRDVLELRWWDATAILESTERFGPPGLVELIRRRFVA